jgi:predicted DCC family thiol-disulfide oxidoreductase YuxK
MTDMPDQILLFDGVCNLCTWAVKFVLKRDIHEKFRYASVQSAKGKEILKIINGNDNMPTSVIYYKKGKTFYRSDAVLEVLMDLKRGWHFFYIFKVIPLFLRDGIYKWVAKRRYNLFGIKDECYVPQQPVKHLFYDD